MQKTSGAPKRTWCRQPQSLIPQSWMSEDNPGKKKKKKKKKKLNLVVGMNNLKENEAQSARAEPTRKGVN